MASNTENAARLRPYWVRPQNSFGQGVNARHGAHQKTLNGYFTTRPVTPRRVNFRSCRHFVIVRQVLVAFVRHWGQTRKGSQATTLLMRMVLFSRRFLSCLARFNL